MVTKRVTTRRKVVAPPSPSPPPSTKSFSTAALGVGMVILTNYQAEVKQMMSLLIKAIT